MTTEAQETVESASAETADELQASEGQEAAGSIGTEQVVEAGDDEIAGVQAQGEISAAPENLPAVAAQRFCPNCGNPVKAGQAFCPSCGTKQEVPEAMAAVPKEVPAADVTVAPAPIGPEEKPADSVHIEIPKEVKIKFDKKLLVIIAAVVAVVILGIVFVPDMVATPQQLLEQGKYEKAYQKADDSEKSDIYNAILDAGKYEIAFELAGDDDKLQTKAIGCAIGEGDFSWAYANAPTEEMKDQVLVANAVATTIPDIQDMAKDASSVRLSEGYYLYDTSRSGDLVDAITMKIAGANSYGSTVQNYYVYTYESSSKAYECYNSVTDLTDDTIYKYLDSTSEKIEKLLDNLTRAYIRDAMSDSSTIELPDAFVDGINKLIEDDKINEVTLMTEGALTGTGVTT